MKNFYIIGICTAVVGIIFNSYMLLKPLVEWEQQQWLLFMAIGCIILLVNGVFFIQYLVHWQDKSKRNNLLLTALCGNSCYWLVLISPLIFQCLKVVFYTN